MKKAAYLILIPIVLAIVWSFHNQNPIQRLEAYPFTLADTSLLKPEEVHKQKAALVTQFINLYHYSDQKLNNETSQKILSNYLDALDGNRLYFLASDIERFRKNSQLIDDYLLEGNLDPIYEMFNVRKQRVLNRLEKIIADLPEQKFDYEKDEYLLTNRDSLPWPQTEAELDGIWRKQIKNSVLSLMLAGKTEEESKETVLSRYERSQRYAHQYKSEDVFEIFMNSLSSAFDPHTTYFSPVNSESFNMELNKSFEGIGARLQNQDDFTVIVEIIPGGPAFKSKELKADDKIVGVAQGDDEEFTDVVGWRINDVVSLIRGDKGTVVRLQVIPGDAGANAPPTVIRLVRDKIKLEEQSASKRMIEVPGSKGDKTYQFGVITIPNFYVNFEDYQAGVKDYKSTTNDVKKLITALEAEGADGLIIDLRNNGGGYLQEAIALSGLFIKRGPVVQVRNKQGEIEMKADNDPEKFYEGPLLVMVNEFSASASEIFAGVIQDYERGLIVGEQTFGKGTVQQMIDLTRFIKNSDGKNAGQVKLTLQKYYRATGSSTQHKGVVPDIELPSLYGREIVGESSEASALPWDEIKSANFTKEGDLAKADILKLQKSFKKRLKTDEELQTLLEMIDEIKELRKRDRVSLNLEKRKVESDAYTEKQKERDELFGEISKEDKPFDKVGDPYLKNSLRILRELIENAMG